MWFIGDCHGKFDTYKWIIDKMVLPQDRSIYHSKDTVEDVEPMGVVGLDCSLQVGDFGVFNKFDIEELEWMKESPQHKWICGNHDNPHLVNELPNCLGYHGYDKDLEMFWLGGGLSIDKEWRTQGLDWWAEEELPFPKLYELAEEFADLKPKIVVSHECPISIKRFVLGFIDDYYGKGRHEEVMEHMFQLHQPEYWIAGHYHKRYSSVVNGCKFEILNEMSHAPIKQCLFEIPGLKW
jgi:hypothetical protein